MMLAQPIRSGTRLLAAATLWLCVACGGDDKTGTQDTVVEPDTTDTTDTADTADTTVEDTVVEDTTVEETRTAPTTVNGKRVLPAVFSGQSTGEGRTLTPISGVIGGSSTADDGRAIDPQRWPTAQ